MTLQGILPQVFVNPHDYERLRPVAIRLAGDGSEVANFLLAELDRSIPCAGNDLPEDAVAMGCSVTFRVDGQPGLETGVLVFPQDYVPRSGHISVLSPLGAALFGLSAGSSMRYLSATRMFRTVTVLRVEPPDTSNVLAFRPRPQPPASPMTGPDGPDDAA